MNDLTPALASMIGLSGVVAAILVAGRRRLRAASIVLGVVIGALWAVDLAAISQGYRDWDGFVDCGDACDVEQVAAGAILVWAPLAVVALTVVVAVASRR